MTAGVFAIKILFSLSLARQSRQATQAALSSLRSALCALRIHTNDDDGQIVMLMIATSKLFYPIEDLLQ